MNDFRESIDRQLAHNRKKNLFADDFTQFMSFTPETIASFSQLGRLNKETEKVLLDYVTEKAVAEFCRANQFYSFEDAAKKALRDIYVQLLDSIKKLGVEPIDAQVKVVTEQHYQRLREWLAASNLFAEKMYQSGAEKIASPVCSEYTPQFQLDLLQIDPGAIMGPLLDIGCGESGGLVAHLRTCGVDAYGVDRLVGAVPYCVAEDWLSYEYGLQKWGTVISNLGFSNHFVHHHNRVDGAFALYASKYMQILNSLKVGGKFYYAPALPFIEQYLSTDNFYLETIDFEGQSYKGTVVTRIV